MLLIFNDEIIFIDDFKFCKIAEDVAVKDCDLVVALAYITEKMTCFFESITLYVVCKPVAERYAISVFEIVLDNVPVLEVVNNVLCLVVVEPCSSTEDWNELLFRYFLKSYNFFDGSPTAYSITLRCES